MRHWMLLGVIGLSLGAASACSGNGSSQQAAGGSSGSAGSGGTAGGATGGADSGATGGTAGATASGGSSGSGAAGGSSAAGGSGATGGSGGSGGSAGSGGGSGLLSGCTVGADNQPSCSTPSGWTLVIADGFDSNALANSRDEQLHGSNIECSFTHDGSCALANNVTGSGNSGRWMLDSGVIGSSREVYVSWWEYLDSAARSNTEMFLFEAHSKDSVPQNDVLDSYGSPDNCASGVGPRGSYNCTNGELTLVDNTNNSNGINRANYGAFVPWNLGSWRQYEVHFIANTPGNSDGSAEVYIDGKQASSWANKNFNANVDMTGMGIWVGGVYTAIKWTDSSGNCQVSNTGTATDCNPFSACSPCPVPPDFHRYWDDVIVLKK